MKVLARNLQQNQVWVVGSEAVKAATAYDLQKRTDQMNKVLKSTRRALDKCIRPALLSALNWKTLLLFEAFWQKLEFISLETSHLVRWPIDSSHCWWPWVSGNWGADALWYWASRMWLIWLVSSCLVASPTAETSRKTPQSSALRRLHRQPSSTHLVSLALLQIALNFWTS